MTSAPPPEALGTREIAGAVTWSASGDLTSKIAVIAVSVIAARTLAPERFATYIGLLAAAYLAAAAWDAGVSTLVSVERSRAHAPLAVLARRVVRARIFSFPAGLAAFAIAAFALGVATRPTAFDVATFALVSLAISLQQPILAALRADLEFRGASLAIFVGRWLTVGVLGAGFALDVGRGSVGLVGFAHLVGEAATVVAALAMSIRKRGSGRDVAWDARRIGLRNALPYAANTLISIAYNRLDVLLVAVLVPAAQLAAYAPASRIQDALYFIPSAIAIVALPYLSRHGPEADAARWTTMRRLWLIGLLVTLPASVAITAFMPDLINVVLGPAYAATTSPSRILAWSMPLAVIGGPLLAYLISRGRGAQTTTAFIVAGVASLTLHLILDPRFGAIGAAVASLARDAANVAVAGFLVWRARGVDGVAREAARPETGSLRHEPLEGDSP